MVVKVVLLLLRFVLFLRFFYGFLGCFMDVQVFNS